MSDVWLDFLTELTANDRILFEHFFDRIGRRHLASYENSWAFINSYCPNYCLKYLDGSSFFVLNCCRDVGGWRVSLINFTGGEDIQGIQFVSSQLSGMTDINDIVIRFVDRSNLDLYTALGFRVWGERYPQVIFSLRSLQKHQGPSWSSFRHRINRFLREFDGRYSILPPLEAGPDMASDAVRAWAKAFGARRNLMNYGIVDLDLAWYDRVIDFYYSRGLEGIDHSVIITIDGQPAALGCASAVSRTSVAIYTNLASSEVRGLSEFLLLTLAQHVSSHGYDYANLGHSHSETEFRFKRKVVACEMRPVYAVRKVADRKGTRSLTSVMKTLCGGAPLPALPARSSRTPS